MTRIQTFEPREWYDAIEALGQLHKAELESHITDLPRRLNREMYDTMFESGVLVNFGVFDGDKMVGYAFAFVHSHPHYEMVTAQHDSLFIHPDYRLPRVALRLMAAVEAECRARGAEKMAWVAKPGTAFQRLLDRLCRFEEMTYIKEL